ncbi:PH domain-containing protein [Leucobacter sp. CSA1]|uniref:PH domain-containing protein n=1 Tax=Leucobacter chromiisoli TaxID=2796471 RepID=A0A934Q538_9MICO|nr:PH domain-containing protein [Leucobacter chromiisoli]MBK0417788.1 PH domain-containing protein [Leucobacter chromiisoli]
MNERPVDGTDAPAIPRAETLPGTPDAEGWRRLHPLSPLLQGGLIFVVIVGVIIANLRDSIIGLFVGGEAASENGGDVLDLFSTILERGLLLAVIGGLLGFVALVVFFAWLSWRFHTYRVGDDAVEARKGILFRQHRRAPLERIQSVNLKRPLLARALGLTQIEIQTAGQGGKVDLNYLGHKDAKTVREQIIRRAAISKRGGRPAPGADSAFAVSADSAAAVSADGTPYAQAHGAFEQRVSDFADFDIDPSARERGALVSVPVGRLVGSILLSWEVIFAVVLIVAVPIAAAVWEWAILAGLIPLLVVMVGVAFGQFNKGFNFTLSHSEDGVRTSAGLTSTSTETIPFGRIHAVEARQPLLWRRFGWWKVRITRAGQKASESGQSQAGGVVLPVGFEADVIRVLETLLPGIGDEAHEAEGLRDGLVGSADGYLGAGPRAGWVLWWGRRRAGIRVDGVDGARGGAGVRGVDGARGDHGADEGATLRIRRGALTRSFTVAPILRAQSVQLHRPLVHRVLGLATIQFDTVLGPVNTKMRGLELERARQVFDLLADAVVRVQSGEAERRAAAQPAPRVDPEQR